MNGIQGFIAKNTKKIHDIIDSLLRSYNSESETTISKGSSIETNNYEIILPTDKSANTNEAQIFLKDSDEDESEELDNETKVEVTKNDSDFKEDKSSEKIDDKIKNKEILGAFLEIENKAQKEKLKLLESILEENKLLKKKLKEKELLLEKSAQKTEN